TTDIYLLSYTTLFRSSIGRLISQAEDDDARRFTARHGENVSEIQIECKHRPALSRCFCDDLGIGKSNETFFAEMHCIVVSRTQGDRKSTRLNSSHSQI